MDDEFVKKLLILYPAYNRVTGPYLRKDGRKHLCLNNTSLPNKAPGKKRTLSWPKALVEVRDNRRLLDNETVDHDDRDFTNDDLKNLIIRDRAEHIRLDALRAGAIEVECVWCKDQFILRRHQRNSIKAGPFCSRTCSGQYGASVQNKQIEKLKRDEIKNVEYFLLDKS